MPDEFDPRTHMPFGKFGPGADHRTLDEVPSDYLDYLLNEEESAGWVSERYGQDFVDEIQEVMDKRDMEDTHWNENEEPTPYI